jgi:hypothetical protein
MTKPTIMGILMVRKLIDEPIRRKIREKSILFGEVFPTQNLRKLVTLNEYMPI